jgi:hypothetical protein
VWRDGAPAKEAQQCAAQREAAQARIPKHLLYSKGWPQVMPTQSEARLLSEVRRSMADIMQVPMHYTNADAVLDRYAKLIALYALRRKAPPIVLSPIQQGL